MVVLTAMTGALLVLLTHETRELASQVDDLKLLNLVDAGLQRGLREIREDASSTTQRGTADLRGATVTETGSVGDQDSIRYLEDGNATIDCIYGQGSCADQVFLQDFDRNYAGTRIYSVQLRAVAARDTGGTGATLELSYATDAVFPNANTKLTVVLPNSTTLTEYSVDITNDRVWSWDALFATNFKLRAIRTAGNRDILLGMIYLRVTYEIDTATESWSTGSYQSYPLTLGDGSIDSVTITAEQGKVHLNTASELLLRYLLEERGVASASTLATNLVNYRSVKNFDSIEEIKQVSGFGTAEYDAVKNFVTVHSSINVDAVGPSAARAPVNVNTAPREVLEAVFDALLLGATDATSLATDILTARAAAPFTCFYSSDASVTTDFYDFVMGRSYLSSSGNPDERDMVLDNADASPGIPVSGSNGYNALTTEFCYATNAFRLESAATVHERSFRAAEIRDDNGSHLLTTYQGDLSAASYRREGFGASV